MTPTLGLLAVAAVCTRFVLRRRRRGRSVDPRRELVSVAVHLARSTRLGMTPVEALEDAAGGLRAEVGHECAVVCAQLRRGLSLDEALEQWYLRADSAPPTKSPLPAQDVRLLCAAARFAGHHGRGLPEVFDAVAAALVDRIELTEEVGALTSQARASVAALCALPLVGLAMITMIAPASTTAMFATPLGWGCLGVAVALDLAALRAGAVLTARAVR